MESTIYMYVFYYDKIRGESRYNDKKKVEGSDVKIGEQSLLCIKINCI